MDSQDEELTKGISIDYKRTIQMRKSRANLFLVFTIFLSNVLSSADLSTAWFDLNIQFQQLSYQQGLIGLPYYMCQDRFGYIWFGCSHGACRYDGYEFKLYAARPDSAHVRGKKNQGICEDLQGNIWIAERETGIFKLDRQSGKFTNYLHDPNDSTTLSTNDIGGFFLDSHGYLWIAAIKKIYTTYVVYLDCMDTRTGLVKR
ncbi:hypothetical protein JW998_02995 [candidate division KSB1 bacterium]|nr:hypothetical protein [candidate division KSB1 bacterium]